MVVIKGSGKDLAEKYGKDFLSRLSDFADIIGYSIEGDSEDIKVEFNPDRPDLFSFPSLNNAMKCYYDKNFWILESMKYSGISFKVDPGVEKLRAFTTGFVASGLEIGNMLDHLMEYQERIHDNIGKNRLKVSIGIHDLDKVSPPFFYRAADRNKVKFTTYDGLVSGSAGQILEQHPKGRDYAALIPSDTLVPVIFDSNNEIMSLPPVINGSASRLEEKSRNLFVDITGNDRKAVRDAYYLLAYEMKNLGYRVQAADVQGTSGVLRDTGFDGRLIRLSRGEFARITGMNLSRDSAIVLLRKMGYQAEPSSEWIDVAVPGNRVDVMGQVDLIEDVVKAYGMSRVKEKPMDLPLIGKSNPSNDFSELLRDALTGAGFQEVRTFVVSSGSYYTGLSYKGGVEVLNPKSLDYSVVRDRLNINMLELLRINKRRSLPQNIFEIGDVYNEGEQETRLCIMVMDSDASFSRIKQAIDYIAVRLGISRTEIRAEEVESFIQGRSGRIYLDGTETGFAGEVHPEMLQKFDLQVPVVAAELKVAALFTPDQ